MRFFHARHRVALSLDSAKIMRGGDWFGRSEFFFRVPIKPRHVDFELFHQSVQAENCFRVLTSPTEGSRRAGCRFSRGTVVPSMPSRGVRGWRP